MTVTMTVTVTKNKVQCPSLNVFTMDCFCLWHFFSLKFYVDCIHHSKIIAKLLCKLLIKGVYDMLMAYKIFLLPGHSKMMNC